jgi:hypothetical protein
LAERKDKVRAAKRAIDHSGNRDEVAVSMAARRVPARAKEQPALTKALQSCRAKLQMLIFTFRLLSGRAGWQFGERGF